MYTGYTVYYMWRTSRLEYSCNWNWFIICAYFDVLNQLKLKHPHWSTSTCSFPVQVRGTVANSRMTLDAAIGKNTTAGKTHMMCVEGTEGQNHKNDTHIFTVKLWNISVWSVGVDSFSDFLTVYFRKDSNSFTLTCLL